MQNNNYGGGQRKHRYGGGQNSGGGHRNNHGPRRNWPVAREKYLGQARDAMAAGDRVLAENYLQHADHCWRMMMEEGQNRPRPQAAPGQEGENAAGAQPAPEEFVPENTNALPAFITTPYGQPQAAPAGEPPPVQNWEERDA